MPKANGTFSRQKIMLVTDDPEGITKALGLLSRLGEVGYLTQQRPGKTQLEFRFVHAESHLVKAAKSPAELAAARRESARKSIGRYLGRDLTDAELDRILAAQAPAREARKSA